MSHSFHRTNDLAHRISTVANLHRLETVWAVVISIRADWSSLPRGCSLLSSSPSTRPAEGLFTAAPKEELGRNRLRKATEQKDRTSQGPWCGSRACAGRLPARYSPPKSAAVVPTRLFTTQAIPRKMEDLTARTEETSIKDSSNSVKSSQLPPADGTVPPESLPNQGIGQLQQKKEKKPKGPKQPSAPASLPLSPALIDLRVGHILRCIPHENADSLYVSTIAMGDPEGTENTQKDAETGRIVRTVCSGLRGLIPLEQMQDRKVIVMANLKPVTMRGIKSAAMVLAASPPPKEGEDPHSVDRVVELVSPPEGSEGGDRAFFEGWEYGQGKGPEKVLNPKKKQWEAIQPGLYTSEDLTVVFDAARVTSVEGGKGELVIESAKGKCKVPSLKEARLS